MNFDDVDSDSLVELVEICEDTENIILKLEKGFNSELFKAIKRNLHNLKGTCGMFDFDALAKICHDTETYLERYGERELNSETTDFLLSVVVHIIQCLSEQDGSYLEKIPHPPTLEGLSEPLPPKSQSSELEGKVQVKTNKEAFYKNQLDLDGLNIYHLDDDPALLEIFKFEVEEIGPIVSSFQKVSELREGLLQSGLPDLIVIDNKLANGENGIETIKSLESLIPSIPKILYSAYLSNEIILEALAKGAYAVLQKPLEIEILKFHLIKIKRKIYREKYLHEVHNFLAEINDRGEDPSFEKVEIVKKARKLLTQFK